MNSYGPNTELCCLCQCISYQFDIWRWQIPRIPILHRRGAAKVTYSDISQSASVCWENPKKLRSGFFKGTFEAKFVLKGNSCRKILKVNFEGKFCFDVLKGNFDLLKLHVPLPSLDGLNSMYRKLVDFMFGCNTVFFGMFFWVPDHVGVVHK